MKKLITLLTIITILIISCKNKTETDATRVIEGSETKEEPISTQKEIQKIVTAKRGLNYRDKPKGKSIGKFKNNTEVTVIEFTGVTQEITDEGKKITGEWVGVKLKNKTVYVFDAFLKEPKKKIIEPYSTNPIDEAMLIGYIIPPGSYHNDEIPNKITTKDWMGIFKNNGTYSIEKTGVNISKHHDPIVDKEDQKTGKEIKATNPKNCYLLINNISYLTERNIDTVLTKPLKVYPTKSYTFTFNNIDYTLLAEAKNKQNTNNTGDYVDFENYKLFLEKNENGTKTTQLLLLEKLFNDKMTEILFIGDIDGDTIPDLLINTSNHYNTSVPTLYLSKEAHKGKILKIVSLHKSVGC